MVSARECVGSRAASTGRRTSAAHKLSLWNGKMLNTVPVRVEVEIIREQRVTSRWWLVLEFRLVMDPVQGTSFCVAQACTVCRA